MRKTSYNGTQSNLTNRTMTMTTNTKFQNIQKLNSIVGQVSHQPKQASIRAARSDMSDKVLDLIKHRIKNNYDKLYENYEDNKSTILKQIQHVETNTSSENTMSKGFEHTLKEKSLYDKSKAELQVKQKKLTKLKEIRNQLRLASENYGNSLQDDVNEKGSQLEDLEDISKVLDYQTLVLSNMKAERRSIKLTLKERYDRVLLEEQEKGRRIQQLENGNHTKLAMLNRIESNLKKEEQCEIPEHLAEELERKLQEYEGKQIYENIAKHQNQISEENRKRQEEEFILHTQDLKQRRQAREKQELKDYQMAYNFYLLKQQEQEKIKKICGVTSLSEIANNSLQSDFENLQEIKRQINKQIKQVKAENKEIKKQIDDILREGIEFQSNEETLQQAEKACLQAEKSLKQTLVQWDGKENQLNQWHALVQMMSTRKEDVRRQNIGQAFKAIMMDSTINNSACNGAGNCAGDEEKESPRWLEIGKSQLSQQSDGQNKNKGRYGRVDDQELISVSR